MHKNKLMEADAVKDENGNKENSAQSDLQYFIDDELHKKLKEEVNEMYAAWDEADLRIRNRLENLTSSLTVWKQFENGLNEFQETLGKDRGALYGLKQDIETGRPSEDLVDNVQQVAKLLSEKLENQIHKTITTSDDITHLHLHPETALQFIGSSSNGSLSDSGISDGGNFSDCGLSERERRLGALRRLAKQLENALSPSSEVLKTITQRMEAAESELKTLQDTCRELIIRTSNQLLNQHGCDLSGAGTSGAQSINVQIPIITIKGKSKRSPQSKRKNKRRNGIPQVMKSASSSSIPKSAKSLLRTNTASEPDPDDPRDGSESLDEFDSEDKKQRWLWRVAKMAVPIQITIVTLLCAACLLEPSCCDALNNFSMSLTPHLKYVKGPPPI